MCCASPKRFAKSPEIPRLYDRNDPASAGFFAFQELASRGRFLQGAEPVEQLRAVERLQQIALGAGPFGAHDRADVHFGQADRRFAA